MRVSAIWASERSGLSWSHGWWVLRHVSPECGEYGHVTEDRTPTLLRLRHVHVIESRSGFMLIPVHVYTY